MATIRVCPRCRANTYGNPSLCSRCGHRFRKPGLSTRQSTLLAVVAGAVVLLLALLFLWLPDIPTQQPPSRPVQQGRPAQGEPAATGKGTAELKSVIQQTMPAVVRIDVVRAGEQTVGSGFLIDGRGSILTNEHVIAGGGRIFVTIASGEEVEAKVKYSDRKNDLALLEAPSLAKQPYLTISSAAHLEQGDHVVALGSPEGLTNSVSDGIISALDRTIQVEDGGILEGLIQTTAPISHGSSGGPLVEVATGHVIGVTTAGSGTGDNLGFAVAGDTVLATLKRWLKQ